MAHARSTSFAVMAALLSGVAAQPMTTSWYTEATQCATNSLAATEMPAWRVRGPRGLCLQVPGQNPTGSYIAYCNAAGSGGVMAMCTDHACAACGAVNAPFLNGACMTVPATVTPGNAFPRVAINCSALAGEEPLVPVDGTAATVTYHADPDCVVSPTNNRTEFTTLSGRCNALTPTTSMSVDCVGDTGVYKVFAASGACEGASDDTPFFASGQCLPQPEGEPAISVMCAQPPSPSPTPSPTPSQTPSLAARSPSGTPTPSASTVVAAQSGAQGSALANGVAALVAVAGAYLALRKE